MFFETVVFIKILLLLLYFVGLVRNSKPLGMGFHARELKAPFTLSWRSSVLKRPHQFVTKTETLLKPVEFENARFSFSCGRKPFWKLFENGVVMIYIIWFSIPSFQFLQHKSKITGDSCVF